MGKFYPVKFKYLQFPDETIKRRHKNEIIQIQQKNEKPNYYHFLALPISGKVAQDLPCADDPIKHP